MNFQSKPPEASQKVMLYIRVSTGKQAIKDLSIPDQRSQMHAYCENLGWSIVDEFIDEKSGRTDNRPGFQDLIEAVDTLEGEFNTILVHSLSRFFRDAVELEIYHRKLKKRGIRLVSITQDFEDSPNGDLLRKIIGILDEHNSHETAKHVKRSLIENARQGFWCGGRPPYGYELAVVAKRGTTEKKRLVLNHLEAEVVRKIFSLYLQGDGSSGPLGVKKITSWLNEKGFLTRGNCKWGVAAVHRMLSDTSYKGRYVYNKHGDAKESVHVDVPEIVSASTFDDVQRALPTKSPNVQSGRTGTGAVLLSTVAKCCECGGNMQLRTGKSGRYRYYTCATQARQGKNGCKGVSIRLDKLDSRVIEWFVDEYLTRDRASKVLDLLLQRRMLRRNQLDDGIENLKRKRDEADTRLRRLFDAIENGTVDLADADFKDRIETARNRRDAIKAKLDSALKMCAKVDQVTLGLVGEFTDLLREHLVKGPLTFRRAYIRAVLRKITVHKDEADICDREGRSFKIMM